MRFVFGLILCGLVACSAAFAADVGMIGSVKNTTGQCTIMRGTESIVAVLGTPLRQNDTLQTGSNASMGVLLRDDTSLSLGENSAVVLDEFVFDPANDKLGMLATFTKGTAAVLTGKIAQLNPEAAKFQTPLATIGIRGTRFAVKVDN